jgi:hypothetical protein
MILGLLGRLFEAVGRLRGGPDGADLAHVGGELRRLAHPSAQAATSSR